MAEAVNSRRTFFDPIRPLTSGVQFESWERRMDFMLWGLEVGPCAVQTRDKTRRGAGPRLVL